MGRLLVHTAGKTSFRLRPIVGSLHHHPPVCIILSPSLHQLVVCTLIDDSASGKDYNFVGVTDCAQTMSDDTAGHVSSLLLRL
jgi:hypothetical protein